jgi:hypothetical protein
MKTQSTLSSSLSWKWGRIYGPRRCAVKDDPLSLPNAPRRCWVAEHLETGDRYFAVVDDFGQIVLVG